MKKAQDVRSTTSLANHVSSTFLECWLRFPNAQILDNFSMALF